MTARYDKSRQKPLGPDEGFDELLNRLIRTNEIERAQRDRTNRNGPIVQHEERHSAASDTAGP